MKKYIVLSFLFLLVSSPIFAAQNQTGGQGTTTQTQQQLNVSPSPTGSQVKNQNEIKTQNQGEEQQLNIQTEESEQLNQEVDNNLNKVSDQVQELLDTVGAKGGIGQQVKEIAQNQVKMQDQIKSNFDQLNSRGTVAKFFIGSDKKLIKTMEQKMEQNRLMIQQLEQLKLQTKNSADLKQLQETITLMTNQNTALQNKVNTENKINGIFGWLINLFN